MTAIAPLDESRPLSERCIRNHLAQVTPLIVQRRHQPRRAGLGLGEMVLILAIGSFVAFTAVSAIGLLLGE